MIAFLTNRRSVLLIFCLVCTYTLASAQCNFLVWSDEFEGTGAPNSLYWNYDLGGGGWGNNEVQTYTNSTTNVRQEGGKLIIDAIKSGGSWTSARIKTQNKMTFTYGKVVFRAKLPSGGGTWPALWMLAQSITSVGWPDCGEIDVMEHIGNNLNRVQSALHTRSSYGNTVNVKGTTVSTATTQFHNYAVSWSADRIAFSVDDVVFYTYAPATKTVQNYPFTSDQFLIMNIAMGGNLGGTIDPALTSARLEVEYVRLYEERTTPLITGPLFVYENQDNLSYQAPVFAGVDYNWSVPPGAAITSGQGTNQVTVDWGDTDGTLGLDLTGNTGCESNSVSLNITTIVEPTGDKYLAHSFATSQLTGWTSDGSGAGVSLQKVSDKLKVAYNTTSLKYIQYEMPKAVDVQHYSIVKLPISIPGSSATVPELIMTFRDGNGNETISTSFELDATVNDGVDRLYSYNFDGLWDQNNPAVNPNMMKYVRIYILPGQGTFNVSDLYFYNNETAPTAPAGLTAQVDGKEVTLAWQDVSNATTFHLYRSDTETGTYARLKSNLETSENPYVVIPTTGTNYYKVSAVNANGESALSNSVEAIALVTATENELEGVSIFPNPSTGKFKITFPEQVIDKINLYDLQGREQVYQVTKNDQHITLTLHNPSQGIYFLKLIHKNKSKVYKILVE